MKLLSNQVRRQDGSAHTSRSASGDITVLGGDPAFAEPLHVGCPNIGDQRAFEARVADILERRWLTNAGRYVREFEQRIAEVVGVKHCIAMCNGTVALEIAIRALGLSGEVIVPSFSFVPTDSNCPLSQFTLFPARVTNQFNSSPVAAFPTSLTEAPTPKRPTQRWPLRGA